MVKQAIVIGGTGMLKGVTLWLAEQHYHVFVIGRSRKKLNDVVKKAEPGRITPVSVDYHEDNNFRTKVAEIIRKHSPIELAVTWIHSSARHAFDILSEEIASGTEANWRLFHVRGSTAALSTEPVPTPQNCLYRQILLGFVIENGQSRWLTHQEIVDGIIKAIEKDQKQSIIGSIEPWEKRP